MTESITTLNIDGEQFNVDEQSEAVQRMVAIFNGWNQQEAEATDKLMMVKAAKSDLSRQIIMQVRQDQQASENEKTDTTDATTVESTTDQSENA